MTWDQFPTPPDVGWNTASTITVVLMVIWTSTTPSNTASSTFSVVFINLWTQKPIVKLKAYQFNQCTVLSFLQCLDQTNQILLSYPFQRNKSNLICHLESVVQFQWHSRNALWSTIYYQWSTFNDILDMQFDLPFTTSCPISIAFKKCKFGLPFFTICQSLTIF